MEAIKPRGSGSGQARVRRDYEARATVAGGGSLLLLLLSAR